MLLQWKHPDPDPPGLESEAKYGNVRLLVREDSQRQWQSVILCFGRFSEQTHEECLESWPREALKLARTALDEFEAQLPEADEDEEDDRDDSEDEDVHREDDDT